MPGRALTASYLLHRPFRVLCSDKAHPPQMAGFVNVNNHIFFRSILDVCVLECLGVAGASDDDLLLVTVCFSPSCHVSK